jgi:hypothetical protein
MGRAWILCKKMFSLALVFNALLTIACAAGIIAGFYWFFPDWQPFYPYLYSGIVFWVVIAAAAINVFPSALVGRKLHTGRFLFHHYFYGFLVLVCASLYVITFTSVPLGTIFLVNNTSMEVNTGRFFLLGGLTLVLDDLPDVSRRLESGLNWLKAKVLKGPRLLIATQAITGAVSLYLSVAILLAMMNVPEWVTIANFILLFTVLVTSITSFVFVRKRIWRHIPATTENGHH